MALCGWLGVGVHIEYLDGRPFDSAEGLGVINIPDSTSSSAPPPRDFTPVISLLYRPGHYDILYELK